MAERRYRCTLCRDPEFPWGLEFSSHEPVCPKCGEGGGLIPLVRVHFYSPDPTSGPIVGDKGKRFRVACSPNATNPNGVPCTGEPGAVTCPECRKTREWQAASAESEAVKGGVLLS